MAPFNLSDLAVKEMKIPRSQLSPAKEKSFVPKLLTAFFLDFWAIFWATTLATSLFKVSFQVHLTTKGLNKAWGLVSLSPFTVFAWTAIAVTYFFTSYYLNHGQTAGMKLLKCRVKMRHHNVQDSLRWAIRSFGIYVSMGLMAKAFSASVDAHDHLWHELIAQKEETAPDVRTLKPEVKAEELWKVAA